MTDVAIGIGQVIHAEDLAHQDTEAHDHPGTLAAREM
jgi:hypothetical protein